MIDAHFHCWRLSRGDYGWLTPALHAIHRDVTVQDWLSQAQAQGIEGGILVQAAATEAETDFLLDQAQACAQVLGVVGWVDWLAHDVAQRIQALASRPKLVGLRPMLQDLPDTGWIAQPQLDPALKAMARHDLVFDALVRTEHLEHLGRMMDRQPELKVVIDHGAKPKPTAPLQEWSSQLRHLARTHGADRLVCKWSGLWTELADPSDHTLMAQWADTLLDIWGPQRLLWGSDWPVLELAADYDRWHSWTLGQLQGLSATERTAILGENARRFYGV